VRTPFGPDWQDLGLHDVLSFFESPHEEAQLWDGKGGTISPKLIRRSVAGFANSVLGGYTVLGVTGNQQHSTWTVDHWQPPTGEVTQWVTDCLSGHLDPQPAFDVSPWQLPDGGALAVIRTWPVAIPPCVTSEGYIYERVGTSTKQITDAAVLHRLFERGDASRQRAWNESRDARDDFALGNPVGREHQLSVAVATPSLPVDISHLLFRESLARGVLAKLPTVGYLPGIAGPVRSDISQVALTLYSEDGFATREGYTIRIRRSGSVAVGFSDRDIDSGVAVVATSGDRLTRLVTVACETMRMLGAIGPMHLAVRLLDGDAQPTDLDRWMHADHAVDEVVESLVREAKRTLGTPEWEPEGG
jgi:hypothetical protein